MNVNNAKVALLPDEIRDDSYWVELGDILDGYIDQGDVNDERNVRNPEDIRTWWLRGYE